MVYRKDLPEATKAQIREAILHAHNDIKVTGYGDLAKYDPVTPADYQKIRDLVSELGLLREEMLK
jgi:phosphonate transport system substrate-binding protein